MKAENRKNHVSFLIAAAVFGCGTSAWAQNFVLNPSFESPSTGGYIDDGNAAINNPSSSTFWHWDYFFGNSIDDHDAGVQANSNSQLTGTAPDASAQNGWVNGAGDYLYQDVGTLLANTTYQVTVALSAPGGTAYGGVGSGNNQPTSEVDLYNGTPSATGTVANVATNGTELATTGAVTPPNGTFQDSSVSYTTGSSVSGDLIILLQEDTLGAHEQGIFDDVRLLINGNPPPPPPAAWSPNSSGDWNNAGNWTTATVPNAVGAEADLFGAITSNHSIYTDTPITVGVLNFNNANTYEITGVGSLTLQGTSTAQVIVQAGLQELDLPTIVASNTTFNVATGATLLIANPLTINAGKTVTQTGGGSVVYQSIINVGAGASLSIGNPTIGNTLNAQANAKVSITPTTGAPQTVQFSSLTLANGASLDVANNHFIVNYSGGGDPVAVVASYLAAGYNGGHWNGAGIVSSTVASLNATQSALIYSVGYADGADGITGVPSGQIEIMSTLAGDAKLQGNVNFGDFQLLAANFGLSAGWDGGNFTYGSLVNFGDFQLLAQDFGDNSSALTGSEIASLNGFASQFGDTLAANPDGVGFSVVSVPEPVATGLLATVAFGLMGRRRSRTACNIIVD